MHREILNNTVRERERERFHVVGIPCYRELDLVKIKKIVFFFFQ